MELSHWYRNVRVEIKIKSELIKRNIAILMCSHSTVVLCVKFNNSRGFNHLQSLQDLKTEYGNIIFHCVVRWDYWRVKRFYVLNDEMVQPLKDVASLSDLAILVDVANFLSEPITNMHTQFANDLFIHVKTFQSKFWLWKNLIPTRNTDHLPTLPVYKKFKKNIM